MPRFDCVEDRAIERIDAARELEPRRDEPEVAAPLAERLSLRSLAVVLDYYSLHHWEASWLR